MKPPATAVLDGEPDHLVGRVGLLDLTARRPTTAPARRACAGPATARAAGAGGRNRAIARAVRPVRVQHRIAAAPTSSAACHAAWVIDCGDPVADVAGTGAAGSARGGWPTAGSWPRLSARAAMRDIVATTSAGSWPIAVSPDSITASVPSNTALATSLTSARVGAGASIIDSSICVAVIDRRADLDAVADDLLLQVRARPPAGSRCRGRRGRPSPRRRRR